MSHANESVLVVEDDARLAELIRDYLQQQGYRVTVEGRGDRAVERILAALDDLARAKPSSSAIVVKPGEAGLQPEGGCGNGRGAALSYLALGRLRRTAQ